MENMYVLVTISHPVTDAATVDPLAAKPTPIVHTYGPYHYDKANYERRKTIERYADLVRKGLLEVKCCRVQDPERKASFIWGRKP